MDGECNDDDACRHVIGFENRTNHPRIASGPWGHRVEQMGRYPYPSIESSDRFGIPGVRMPARNYDACFSQCANCMRLIAFRRKSQHDREFSGCAGYSLDHFLRRSSDEVNVWDPVPSMLVI